MDTIKYLIPLALAGSLAACHNNDDSSDPTPTPETYAFDISVTNLSNAQPFSPPAAILHGDDVKLWQVGEAASVALEHLAEGGDASEILTAHAAHPQAIAGGALPPGASTTLSLSTTETETLTLSVATMLVNTNDAITGLTGLNLSAMQPGDSRVYFTSALDAGTESNSETAATIPGPAGGGEGFNATRDDVTAVLTYHGGIVGNDDGKADSALNADHRFDNPVMRITITRQ